MANTIKVTIADPTNAPKKGILKVPPSSNISPMKRHAYPIPTSVLMPELDIPKGARKKCNANSATLMISSPCVISPPSLIKSSLFYSETFYINLMGADIPESPSYDLERRVPALPSPHRARGDTGQQVERLPAHRILRHAGQARQLRGNEQRGRGEARGEARRQAQEGLRKHFLLDGALAKMILVVT